MCSRLTKLNSNYVIVGGWVPYLRTVHSTLVHPGTRDVDVLLNDDRALLADAVQALMDAEYLPSAKHPFQLLRVLVVNGEELVFNVDLMHPSEGNKNPEMFEDIMELNIRQNYGSPRMMMKSIAFPSSSIVFDEHLWSDVPLNAAFPRGGTGTRNIPLLDEAGCVLSKCDSVRRSKRERDAFDIYFILTGSRGSDTGAKLRSLANQYPDVQRQLNLLRDYVRDHRKTFEENVARFAEGRQLHNSPAEEVQRLLFPMHAPLP